MNIDFGGGEWIPRDDDNIDLDLKDHASIGEFLGAGRDIDTGNDQSLDNILSHSLTGGGMATGVVNAQNASLYDDDELYDPSVSNNADFNFNGSANGGHATSADGIDTRSGGGSGGGEGSSTGGAAAGGTALGGFAAGGSGEGDEGGNAESETGDGGDAAVNSAHLALA